MKFLLRNPNVDLDLQQDSSWSVCKSYSFNAIIFKGLFIGVGLVVLLSNLICLYPPYKLYEFSFFNSIGTFLLIIIVHEIIHLLFLPNPFNTTVGFLPKKFVFFVTTMEEMSVLRLMLVLVMPTIILTVVPLIISFFINDRLFLDIAFLNLIGSGADIISMHVVRKLGYRYKVKMGETKLFYRI